jgi:superfamily I DNA and/or RNA helicase
MQPDICDFPSQYFYGGKLKGTGKEKSQSEFPRTVFFDLEKSREQGEANESKFNE